MMISLKGRDKAQVLMLLFNASQVQGRGFLRSHTVPMTIEEARELLDKNNGYFDYVQGRVLKVDLSGDKLDPFLYDRDNGQGAAARALWGDDGEGCYVCDASPHYKRFSSQCVHIHK